jgi:hypothetical protein
METFLWHLFPSQRVGMLLSGTFDLPKIYPYVSSEDSTALQSIGQKVEQPDSITGIHAFRPVYIAESR